MDKMAEGQSVELRKADQADSEFAFQAKKAALGDYLAQTWGWDEFDQREFHRKSYDASKTRIIDCRGDRVGIISVEHRPDCLFLAEIYILPEHQRKDIGKFLIQGLLEEAQARSLPIRLSCLRVNHGGLRFYERFGFKVDARDEHYFYMLHPGWKAQPS